MDRWGRATVSLERKGGDTILLTAHCDSLQMVIDELEVEREQLKRLNQDLNAQLKQEVSKTSELIKPPPWRRLSWTIVIILLVAIALWRIGRHFLPTIWSR